SRRTARRCVSNRASFSPPARWNAAIGPWPRWPSFASLRYPGLTVKPNQVLLPLLLTARIFLYWPGHLPAPANTENWQPAAVIPFRALPGRPAVDLFSRSTPGRQKAVLQNHLLWGINSPRCREPVGPAGGPNSKAFFQQLHPTGIYLLPVYLRRLNQPAFGFASKL